MRDWTVLKPGKGSVRMLTPEEIRDLKTRRPAPRPGLPTRLPTSKAALRIAEWRGKVRAREEARIQAERKRLALLPRP